MNYIVFVRDDCPYCDDAIDLLIEKKLKYKVVRFQNDQRYLLNEIKNSFDWHTVPIVISRDGNNIQLIGGYDDLRKQLTINE